MSHAVGVFGTPHRQIQGTPELHEQHEGKISRNNPYSFIRSNFLSIEVIGFLKPEKVEGGRKKSTYENRTTCFGTDLGAASLSSSSLLPFTTQRPSTNICSQARGRRNEIT